MLVNCDVKNKFMLKHWILPYSFPVESSHMRLVALFTDYCQLSTLYKKNEGAWYRKSHDGHYTIRIIAGGRMISEHGPARRSATFKVLLSIAGALRCNYKVEISLQRGIQ